MRYSKLITIVLLFLSFTVFSQEKNQKYSKARVYYDSPSDLELLSVNGLAVDHGLKKKNVFIESVFSVNEIAIAKQLGFEVDIIIDDMQKHISNLKRNINDNQNTSCSNSSPTYITPTNFELGSMGGFYTYAQMLSELDDMRTLYPNLITAKTVISNYKTYENRSFYFVKISDNPDVSESEPEMLFTAIHHAREPASMQQLIFYMWYLLENYATDSEIQSIVDNTQQYFIPILNVDGYIYNETTNPNGGGMWRKNRRLNIGGSRGVDNNRNYSYHWGESGVSSSGAGETWPGTVAFSEPENQAVKWFCEQHNFKMALNNHTYSELLLYPFGYASNTPTPENSFFESISSLMVQDNGYSNIISSDLYPAAGDSDDWMYGDTSTKNKIYAMTPEIGAAFWPNQSKIIPICKKMLFHNITAAHLITNYAVISDISPSFINNLNGTFDYSIKKLGLQNSTNFVVSIVPISSNIVSIGSSQNYNSMSLEQEDTNSISYTLNSSIHAGDTISYKLILNNGEYNSEKTISKIYGSSQAILLDSGISLSNFNSSNWGLSTAEYHSAPSSITDSNFGNYNNGTDSSIELSNALDLNGALSAKLSFYTKWNIESGWDYVQFEVSIDNGSTWIPQCGKLTKNGNAQQNILNEPMYDGAQNTWVKEEIDLSDYLGSNLKFRFQIVSDTNTTEDGFYFDDLEVNVLYSSPTKVESNELLSLRVFPNPMEENLTIDIPNLIEQAEINIYSIKGQKIYSMITNNTITKINLKDFSSGIYFVQIKNDNLIKMVKVIKM